MQGLYVADALAADQSVTGYAVTIDGPEGLRKRVLAEYALIYMLNVPDLASRRDRGGSQVCSRRRRAGVLCRRDDQRGLLQQGVLRRREGALARSAWFTPSLLMAQTAKIPDLTVTDHPIFSILAGQENPLVDFVKINAFFPVDPAAPKAEGAKVIASLRDGSPLMIEHEFGQGRVLTCLTAAGPASLSETLQMLAVNAESPENSPRPSGTTGPAAAPARPSSSPSTRDRPASGPQGSGACPGDWSARRFARPSI